MITKRLLSVQIVLLAGFVSVFALPHSSTSTPAGIAIALPSYVGEWSGEDAEITEREREVLAKDTQFARKTYTNITGEKIFVSIIMSGDDMTSSIHRPERCLVAQGWSVQESGKRFVPMADGKTLEMTRLHNVHPVELTDKSRALLHNLDYYWFVGADEMTSSHLVRTGIDLRDRILHGQAQRWAYVTIATNMPLRGSTDEQITKMIEGFIQKLGPKLTRPGGGPLL
ncbi:MAG: exosortase C-terminal domain/associated protein EpsI [Verrucomicrobiota bacterium]